MPRFVNMFTAHEHELNYVIHELVTLFCVSNIAIIFSVSFRSLYHTVVYVAYNEIKKN